MERYEAIVLGTGGVGSSALFHLAKRGVKALGLDRFPPGHDRGSSHGQTRIIRLAYFEHPNYVPMLRRAYELWAELEQRRGEQLYFQTGLLQVGPPDGVVVSGVLASAREHRLDVDTFTAAEIEQRWPGFQTPDEWTGVFERQAGYLLVERCVLAHLDEAARLGADLRTGVAVHFWRPEGQGIAVETSAGTFFADRLIVTAGPWAGSLLGSLGVPLVVRRKPLFWYRTRDDRYHKSRGCPAYLFETPAGVFYGFPQIDSAGVKVAEHTGGQVVTDPLAVDRGIEPGETVPLENFLQRHLPGVALERTQHAVCMYTMTPDEHFIVDRHPQHPQLVFASGLSGHGFKFTAMLGEALVQMALDGSAQSPIDFLSLRRFDANAKS